MGLTHKIGTWYVKNRAEAILLASAAVIFLSAIGIAQMIGTAVRGASPMEITIYRVLQFVPLGFMNLSAILFGVYLSTLVLLFLDHKKRAQSALFLLGTLGAVVMFILTGTFFAALGPIDLALIVIAFILSIIALGGETFRNIETAPTEAVTGRILVSQDGSPIEFPRAERMFTWLLSGIVLFALVEAHTEYPALVRIQNGTLVPHLAAFSKFQFVGSESAIATNLLATTAFLIALRTFIGYDAERRIAIIGPPEAGKTHSLLGMYEVAKQNSDFNPRNVSPGFRRLSEQLQARKEFAERTEARVDEMKMEYSSGEYFKKNIIIDGLDYPGEYSLMIESGLRLIREGLAVPTEPGSLGPYNRDDDDIDQIWKQNRDNGMEDQFKQEIARVYEEVMPRVTGNVDLQGYVDTGEDTNTQMTGGSSGPAISSSDLSSESSGSGSGPVPDGGTTNDIDSVDIEDENSDDLATDENTETSSGGLGPSEPANTETTTNSSRSGSPQVGDYHAAYVRLVNDILPRVWNADVLVFVFDVETSIRGGDPVEFYTGIADQANHSRTVGVATKADILVDEFKQEYRTSPHDDGYEQFRSFVHQRLTNGPFGGVINALQLKPFPVYFDTVVNEDGEPKPRFDGGRPVVNGFERLLQHLGR